MLFASQRSRLLSSHPSFNAKFMIPTCALEYQLGRVRHSRRSYIHHQERAIRFSAPLSLCRTHIRLCDSCAAGWVTCTYTEYGRGTSRRCLRALSSRACLSSFPAFAIINVVAVRLLCGPNHIPQHTATGNLQSCFSCSSEAFRSFVCRRGMDQSTALNQCRSSLRKSLS